MSVAKKPSWVGLADLVTEAEERRRRILVGSGNEHELRCYRVPVGQSPTPNTADEMLEQMLDLRPERMATIKQQCEAAQKVVDALFDESGEFYRQHPCYCPSCLRSKYLSTEAIAREERMERVPAETSLADIAASTGWFKR